MSGSNGQGELEIKVTLADGVERTLSFDLNALEKVYEKTGENPLEQSFWSKPTGQYEQDGRGNVLYFDEQGQQLPAGKIGKPKRIMRMDLTPAKIKALVWAGLGDAAPDPKEIGKLVTMRNLSAVTESVFNLFTAGMGAEVAEAHPFGSSAPLQ